VTTATISTGAAIVAASFRRTFIAEDNSSVTSDPGPRTPDPGTRALTIAIDGPSGAGKGTVARAVAARLRYRHVDTGAMYRAVAWLAARAGVDLHDESAVARLASAAAYDLENGRVAVDGHDVARAIRTPEIDKAAATVARHPAVRDVLVRRQREMGAGGAIVMEGRDIGTVVFPAADVKVYLDASPHERARRRASDPAHAASEGRPLTDVATALAERDRIDSTRAASPLAQAPDAVVIDTTGLPIDAVVQRVVDLVESRLGPTRNDPA
jgi:cytidylate kinase